MLLTKYQHERPKSVINALVKGPMTSIWLQNTDPIIVGIFVWKFQVGLFIVTKPHRLVGGDIDSRLVPSSVLCIPKLEQNHNERWALSTQRLSPRFTPLAAFHCEAYSREYKVTNQEYLLSYFLCSIVCFINHNSSHVLFPFLLD